MSTENPSAHPAPPSQQPQAPPTAAHPPPPPMASAAPPTQAAPQPQPPTTSAPGSAHAAPPAGRPVTPRTPPAGAPSSAPTGTAGARRIGDVPARKGAFVVSTGVLQMAERILLYGASGIGKTTLASHMPSPLFLDLHGESGHLQVNRVAINSWDELRQAVRDAALLSNYKTLVIDNVSRAQALAAQWVCENIPDKGGERRDSIEKFGFGGGPQLLADVFRCLIADLDHIYKAGKGQHVVLIAHDITDIVPNPHGENFLRYEPDLYQSSKGKSTSSIRNQVVQWVDHVLAIYYDITVKDDEGKAKGHGSRTIYPNPMPTHVAKSRCANEPVVYSLEDPAAIWRAIGCVQ